MVTSVTKKQLENLKFGPTSLDYIKEVFDFVPAYNSITYFEVSKKGPGTLPDRLTDTVPVIVRYPDGSAQIVQDAVGSVASWKHCDNTGEIFYGEGLVVPRKSEFVDQSTSYDEYEEDEYDNLARTVKIPKKQYFY